jgi:hypothetical protein
LHEFPPYSLTCGHQDNSVRAGQFESQTGEVAIGPSPLEAWGSVLPLTRSQTSFIEWKCLEHTALSSINMDQ